MDIEPDAVPEPVTVVLTHPRGRDRDPRRCVDLAPGRTGLDGVEAVELPLEAEVVELAQTSFGLAGEERARAVGAVPVDRAARVDDDERVLRDRLVANARVRSRAVVAERDDRVERRAFRARLVPGLLEPPDELRLGAADELLARELVVHAVGDRGRAPQRVELAWLLDRAQCLDEPTRRHELDTARAERLGGREGEMRRLDGDPPPGEQLGERRDDVARRLVERHARDVARRVGVAEVRVQRRVAGRGRRAAPRWSSAGRSDSER